MVSDAGAVVVVASGGVLGGFVSGAVVVVAGTVVVVAKGGVLGGFVPGTVVAGSAVVGGGVVSLEGAVVGATVGAAVGAGVGGFVSTGGVVSFGLKIVVAMIGGVVSVGTVVVTDRGGFVSGDGGLATVDVVVAERGGFVSALATIDVVVAASVVEVADGLRVVRGGSVSVGSAVDRVDDGDDSDEVGGVGRRSSPLGWCVVVVAVAKLKSDAPLGKALPSEIPNGPPEVFDPEDGCHF